VVSTRDQSLTHLTWKAFDLLEGYSETLGAKLLRPRAQALKGPLMVEVQNIVAAGFCP